MDVDDGEGSGFGRGRGGRVWDGGIVDIGVVVIIGEVFCICK